MEPTAVRRVLLVDDHDDSRELLHDLLESEGHAVTVASDGETALALLSGQTFDVALLDIGLPKLDGYDVARMARERLGDRSPLFVATTGYGSSRDRAEARRAGFDVHFVKPVDLSLLVTTVASSRALP